MATPPKPPSGPTGTTPAPRRRKAATRKPATTSAPAPPAEASDMATPVATKPRRTAAPKPPAKRSTRAKPAAAKPARARAATAARAVRQSAPAKLVSDTRDRFGDRNFFAALLGGLAAIGAAVTATIFATRAAKSSDAPDPAEGAHQADGTDASKSFAAGIADEGSVPE